MFPIDDRLRRSREVREAFRAGTSIHVGRQLGDLLHRAGFVDPAVIATGGGGSAGTAQADAEATLFESPEAIRAAEALGIASEAEMTEMACAWRRWGNNPGSTMSRFWFEAVARCPGGGSGP